MAGYGSVWQCELPFSSHWHNDQLIKEKEDWTWSWIDWFGVWLETENKLLLEYSPIQRWSWKMALRRNTTRRKDLWVIHLDIYLEWKEKWPEIRLHVVSWAIMKGLASWSRDCKHTHTHTHTEIGRLKQEKMRRNLVDWPKWVAWNVKIIMLYGNVLQRDQNNKANNNFTQTLFMTP